MTVGDNTMYFAYDADGTPLSVLSNGTTYYYVTNLQGDVVGLVTSAGRLVVSYTYDAWGKLLSISGDYAGGLGNRNPLRYRGYVYDRETGLYYLQSRYYDPEIGRFINADGYASTGQGLLSNNMFAYCRNNPVIMADGTGNAGTLAIVCTVSAVISGVSNMTAVALSGGSVKDCLLAGMVGAVGGAAGALVAAATLFSFQGSVLGRGVATAITDLGTSWVLNGKITGSDIAWTCVDVTMDMTLSPMTYFYNPIEEIVEQTVVNAAIDGATDVAQSVLFTNEPSNATKMSTSNQRYREYARRKTDILLGIV